ncbi:hypothetical protein Hanom_Chr05g00386381 [Helianthus anomalus]
MTTNIVDPTALTTIGALPRLSLSKPMITSFLSGVLNTNITINAISLNIRLNRRRIMLAAAGL